MPTSLIEHLNVKLLLTNAAKKCLLSGLYFPTKAKIFQVSQHFKRKLWCRHHYGRFKCKTFVDKYFKKLSLSKLYFPAKTLFLSSVSAFWKKIVLPTSLIEDLNVRLLLTNVAKKGLLSGLYFPTKTNFFQVSQHFRRKLWCQHQ